MFEGLVLFMALMNSKAGSPAVFYVSPNGNDTWTGLAAQKSAKTQEGPCASLPAALSKARTLRAKKQQPVTIVLRGGRYSLHHPISLSSEDSNLTIKAYPKEKPVLSGGIEVKNWKVTTDGLWEVASPNGVTPVSIFVNGERRHRPRLPSTDYYRIEGKLPRTPECKDKGFDCFKFKKGDLDPSWHNLQDVEVNTIHIWGMSRLRIKTINPETQQVTFVGSTRYEASWADFEVGYRYSVENVREAMKPGDFYVDSETKRLTYMPREGETLTNTKVVVPIIDQLLLLDGAANVSLQGLSFQETAYVTPVDGRNFPQADGDILGMIQARNCSKFTIEDCTIKLVDLYAIDLGKGCRECTVENCEITDIGGGGIKLGALEYEADESKVAGYNTVRNCLLARLGRLHPASIGVFIGQSPYNKVEHNDIEDLYYTGISLGWSWGYGTSNTHHNHIAFNHISKIGQGILSDMGGVYHLGVAPGTVIENNLIHDVESYSYGGWGLYTDEGSSHVVLQNNVVHHTKSAGFHQHYGKENDVRNNVFAFGREHQIMRSREEDHSSFTFEHNIIYWKDGLLMNEPWGNNRYSMDANVYWHVGGEPFNFAKFTLAEWQARGQDRHSVIADPLFRDAEHNDYRLRENSPALKLGIKSIDVSKVGRLRKK